MTTPANHAKVSLINYGVGNLGSVRNMFKRLGVHTEDIVAPEDLATASRVMLPGVGAFDHGMRALQEAGWVDAVRQHVAAGKPLLGICLGMQLLLDSSDEGELPGFGFIPGRALKFQAQPGFRVPHMGWNVANPTRQNSLFADLEEESRFYFVHSYYAAPEHEENTLARTPYGDEFASAIISENVYGTQFHPEKSHRFGMRLLENFSQL